jgi:hypothetical protein
MKLVVVGMAIGFVGALFLKLLDDLPVVSCQLLPCDVFK